jgi:protein TonB
MRTAPQYPALARSMRIEGSVKADVLVAPNGTVKSVEIKGGHPLLVQSAQNALREWKWEPAPHETHELVELKFAL